MSFDCSRFTFQPWHDFLGVIMQQGRVQLDADWNELVSQLTRRIQAGSLDTFGQAVVPRAMPEAFRIQLSGGNLTIGRGRLYVDGILAENHGGGSLEWDPALAEPVGGQALAYDAQPYLPEAPALPAGGPHLVYLDVWQREITALQHPQLVEKAVGIETTARLQTVWQVKVLEDVGAITPATPPTDIPGWTAATRPSAGRLSTAEGEVAGETGPCVIAAGAGYQGLENQLYRVEIHQGGGPGTATFCWSRDNASITTRVNAINSTRDRLTVESVGRDAILRFSAGDWIEITDDWRELHGLPGELRRILPADGVDDTTREITLETPLTDGLFPVDAQGNTDSTRHTRIRRWDQGGEGSSGQVLESDGSLYHDLNATGSSGAIPVPPAGTQVLLEKGVLVDFDLAETDGVFRTGDYWTFAARTADASVEILDKAPPQGIHHHYCPLAIITQPGSETDLRTFWPPEATTGTGCDCTVCVTPEGHNDGTATLQQAIDQVAAEGGTVCLAEGVYRLSEVVRITKGQSLRIRGQGWKTLLIATDPGATLDISASLGVTLEQFTLMGSAAGDGVTGMVRLHNVVGCNLDRVFIVGIGSGDAISAGLQLSGYVLGTAIAESVLVAREGLSGSGEQAESPLFLSGLRVTDNLVWCEQSGINLANRSLLSGDARISDNLVLGCQGAGLAVTGAVTRGTALRVTGNTFWAMGGGIEIGVASARIQDNDIQRWRQSSGGDGIALVPGLDPSGMTDCQVMGNRIHGISGDGIVIRTAIGTALVSQNTIVDVGGGAVVMADAGSTDQLSISDNQLQSIGAGFNGSGEGIAAIRVIATAQANILNNTLGGFAAAALQTPWRVGILLAGVNAFRLSGNRLQGIGPPGQFAGGTLAIGIFPDFSQGTISENVLERASSAQTALEPANWQAIRVGLPVSEVPFPLGESMRMAANNDNVAVVTASRFYLKPRAGGELAISGNHLNARHGQLSLAEVSEADSCLFTGNHCRQPTKTREALVTLTNHPVAVSNNRFTGANGGIALQVSKGPITITGNLSNGQILVDGSPLGDPWQALNVVTP